VVLAQESECLLTVLGRVYVVAVALELSAEDASKIRLVVDDEDLLLLEEHGRNDTPSGGRRGVEPAEAGERRTGVDSRRAVEPFARGLLAGAKLDERGL
jgi:hypothetical protein